MTNLRNLVALAALIIIPFVLYLGWNKQLVLAWVMILSYLGLLGIMIWKTRR